MFNKKKVIAVVEYKKPSEFKTKTAQTKAIKQEIEVAKKLGCKLLIATDTKESVWVNTLTNKRILDENGNELTYNFNPKDEKIAELIEKVNFSINEINSKIKPKQLVNPTTLAKQIWQDIWSVSGATPENCLYTFVELFIFKYLSDLGVLSQGINFNHLLERFDFNIENPNEEALEFYAGTIRPKIKELFPASSDGTTIINGTIFVSRAQKAVKGYSTVFKKVLYRFRDYGKLEHIDYDFKSQLFESFLKESISKKNWGQFFTPLKIVRAIVEMAKDDIKEGIKICDPACGVGKFLLEPIITKLEYLYSINKNGIKPKISICGFDKGFDNDEQKTIILAKANMLIYFSDLIKENPSLTKEFSNLFNESFILKTNSILGTLSDAVQNEYDLILTNPPYVTSGSSNLKEEIKKDGELIDYFKVNAMGVEGLFLEWIIRALKPTGKAYVVIPDGILNRQNDKNLRQFILDECILDGIISLPLNTFFSTNKKTYILCITKKNNKKVIQKDPVFTYLVSEIGETRDIYRFELEDNDLNEAVTLYSFFKGNKKVFEKINTDKRCKIHPISKFDPDQNWSVDRWWSREEKIELGVMDEDKLVSTLEFSGIINDVSQSLAEYSTFLKDISGKKKIVPKKTEIKLSDKSNFELFIGKRLLKKDIRNIKGSLPIYSANVKEPIAYHTKSNIKDFNNNFILWGIDGDFEFHTINKNTPFVTTDHCGAIRILSEDIIPEYLMLELETKKHLYGFDRGLRASLKNVSNMVIEIPIDEENKFDISSQKEVVERYKIVSELKKEIQAYKTNISDLKVKLEFDSRYKNFPIVELLNIVKGNGKHTRKYGEKNKGEYPVYSASNRKPLTYINTFDFEGTYLTWATNGFAGYIKIIEGKFSINADRGLLKPKSDNIDIHYIRYVLEPILRDIAKGRKGEKGEDEFTKVYPTMVEKIEIPIPIDDNDNPDLIEQKKIAKLYQKIENIKSDIQSELLKIEKQSIDF